MGVEWDPIVIIGTMDHEANSIRAEVVVDSVTSMQAGTTTKVEEEELLMEVVCPSIPLVTGRDLVETINNMIGLAIESSFYSDSLVLLAQSCLCTLLPDMFQELYPSS